MRFITALTALALAAPILAAPVATALTVRDDSIASITASVSEMKITVENELTSMAKTTGSDLTTSMVPAVTQDLEGVVASLTQGTAVLTAAIAKIDLPLTTQEAEGLVEDMQDMGKIVFVIEGSLSTLLSSAMPGMFDHMPLFSLLPFRVPLFLFKPLSPE